MTKFSGVVWRGLLVAAWCGLGAACAPTSEEQAGAQAHGAEREERERHQAEGATKGGGRPDGAAAKVEEMMVVLELPEDEAAKLKGAAEAADVAVRKWDQENGEKLATLETQIIEASKARDLRAQRAAISQAKPLRDARRGLVAERKQKIRDALSSENRLKWDAHRLAERFLELAGPLELSGEQVAAVREAAQTAAQSTARETNPSAAGYLKLEQLVEADVLAESQRQALAEMKKKHPLRSLGGE